MTETLFYDGRCSLCAREITLLKRFNRGNLSLVDIHSNTFNQHATGISRGQMLSVLHFRTIQGDWLTGLDATVTAWRHTPFGWILQPLRWYGVRIIADKLYSYWANKRVCRLDYIDLDA